MMEQDQRMTKYLQYSNFEIPVGSSVFELFEDSHYYHLQVRQGTNYNHDQNLQHDLEHCQDSPYQTGHLKYLVFQYP